MKLDITIKDATPEEVQRLLIGLQVDTLLGPKERSSRIAPGGLPTQIPKTPKTPGKRGGHHGGVSMRDKYQIPFHSTKNKKEYQNAVNLCKRYGLPYTEALKAKEAARPGKEKPPRDVILLPPAEDPKTLEKISPNDLIVGLKVKQIKPDGDRFILGIVTVTARRGPLCEVQDRNGQKHMIQAQCLVKTEA